MNSLTISNAVELRSITDLMKDLITEIPFEFCAEGLKIVAMDCNENALIHVLIKGDLYHFEVNERFSLPMNDFHRSFRHVSNAQGNCVVEIVYDRKRPNYMDMTLHNEAKDTKVKTSFHIIQSQNPRIHIPDTTFDIVFTMSSLDFQKYLRECCKSDVVKLFLSKDAIEFHSKTLGSDITISILPAGSGVDFKAIGDDVFESNFPLKYLEKFSRPITPMVTVFAKQGLPLVLAYRMNCGTVRLLITAMEDEV